MRINITDEDDEADCFHHGRIQEVTDDDEFVTAKCFACDMDGVLKCPDYVEVSYCSEEHRRLHYDDMGEEEEKPFPFMVKFRPGVGRYMVAARDIEPGELIFRESPVALGPNHSSPPSCLDCMRTVDGSYVCPNCNFPVCEEMCALGDEHSEKECKVFSKMQKKVQVKNFKENDTRYWSITVLRVLLLKESDPSKYALVQRMIDHNMEHEKDEDNWNLYKNNVVNFLLKECNLKDRFTEEEIFHVLGALDVNSVKIHSPKQGNAADASPSPGHALYPLTALISHSCICNSKTVLKEDYGNECWATVAIPKGEEITKQYVSPLETTNMRRRKLKSGWYFDCHCIRCCDPTECGSYVSSTACLRCNGGFILPKDPLDFNSQWICQTCGFKTTGEAVDKLVEYFLSKQQSLAPESLDDWEDLFTKATRMFHPNHHVLLLMRISMNAHYIRLSARVGLKPEEIPVEVFMRRKDLLDEVHKVIDIVEPGRSRRRGISLFESSTCRLQIGRLLNESDRFPVEDFIQLCIAETAVL